MEPCWRGNRNLKHSQSKEEEGMKRRRKNGGEEVHELENQGAMKHHRGRLGLHRRADAAFAKEKALQTAKGRCETVQGVRSKKGKLQHAYILGCLQIGRASCRERV